MGKRLLLKTKYHAEFDMKKHTKDLVLEEKQISTKDVIQQIEILNKIGALKNAFIYIQVFPNYADNIGDLRIPSWYNGRFIFAKELSSIVVEFIYNAKLKEQEQRNFLYNLFSAAVIYISEFTPQQMQEYYYDPTEQGVVNYFKNFIAFIEIDNDGSYMNLIYNPKKISQPIIRELS